MRIDDYLKSHSERYYISDDNLEGAKIIIFQCYPPIMDLEAGRPVASMKTWGGVELAGKELDIDCSLIGTAYISNVPLYGVDEETHKLMPEFEGLTHSPRVENEFLREQFKMKMRKIAENENVRVVAYKLEMFVRYYNDFLETAERELVRKLEDRINAGTLKFLEFPRYTIEQIKRFEERYNEFKSAIDDIEK